MTLGAGFETSVLTAPETCPIWRPSQEKKPSFFRGAVIRNSCSLHDSHERKLVDALCAGNRFLPSHDPRASARGYYRNSSERYRILSRAPCFVTSNPVTPFASLDHKHQ